MESNFLEKITQLRARTCDQLPTPELAVLSRSIARLRRSDILRKCLRPGETVPDFSFEDASFADTQFINTNFTDKKSRQTSLYSLLERGPVVLNFFRGFWCSFCKTELEAYEKIQQELDKLGCSYIAVSPQKLSVDPSASSSIEKDKPENYHFVFDEKNRIARQLGIVYTLLADEIELFSNWGVEIDQYNQSNRWELPLPATYIIAPDRTIRFQFVDADFRTRCCPEELIQEIRQLLS